MSPSLAVELLHEYPELVVLVGVAARLARAWQSQLTWSEYRALHRLKRGVLPLVYRFAPAKILVVSEKGGRDDAEYVATLDASVKKVVSDLKRAGGSLHLINALKRRPDTHGDPLSAAHVMWTIPGAGDQVEAYLFRNADGTVDLYAHTEASVDRPLQHLTGEQIDGDDYGVLPELTDMETEP